jgi:Ca2+-binding EF-hand superfamily protein
VAFLFRRPEWLQNRFILKADTKGGDTMTISEIGQSASMSSLYGTQRPSSTEMANTILKELDSDGNGALSTDEIGKGGKRAQRILGADADKDGTVTLDELLSDISKNIGNMPTMMQPPDDSDKASHIMDELDTNGDGVLSTEEIDNGGERAQVILGADADKDGTVTLDELLSDISKNIGNMQPPNDGDMASHIMDELDTNGDGILSTEEIGNGGERAQRILGADADGDGNVTADELVSDISKKKDEQNQSGQADQSVFDLTSMALSRYSSAQTLLDAVQTTTLAMVA